MDIARQYIIQCVVAASNSLRLSSDDIEVVDLLRKNLSQASDLRKFLRSMKHYAPLSRFAYKLQEILNYLEHSHIDFSKFSKVFSEHCELLINDISYFLDSVSPGYFRELLTKVEEKIDELPEEDFEEYKKMGQREKQPSYSDYREKMILEDKDDDERGFFYQNYEDAVIKPIAEIEETLKRLQRGLRMDDDILKHSEVMMDNCRLSEKFGTEIVARMHKILYTAFIKLYRYELQADKELIEKMRACLIVIVALVKNKNVDISQYLKRAEDFGKRILNEEGE